MVTFMFMVSANKKQPRVWNFNNLLSVKLLDKQRGIVGNLPELKVAQPHFHIVVVENKEMKIYGGVGRSSGP